MSIGLFGLEDESTGLAPPPAGQLVTADEVGAALGMAFAARPDLPLLIAAASRTAEDYCHRSFAPRGEVDEYLDGTGRPWLYLRHPPVAAVASVTVGGVALDNTTGGAWTFDPDSGELLRGKGTGYGSGWGGYGYGLGGYRRAWPAHVGMVWPMGFRNVRVQYTGGYDAVPGPVKQAVVILVRHLADASRNTGVLLSERIGDYEYTVSAAAAEADLPFVVRALLDPYVIPVVG